jgi:hypothetical protein
MAILLLLQPADQLLGVFPTQPIEPDLQASCTAVRKTWVGNRLVAIEAD